MYLGSPNDLVARSSRGEIPAPQKPATGANLVDTAVRITQELDRAYQNAVAILGRIGGDVSEPPSQASSASGAEPTLANAQQYALERLHVLAMRLGQIGEAVGADIR